MLTGALGGARLSRLREPMSIQLILPLALAILAGFSIVIQQVLNNNLRLALDSAAGPASSAISSA